MKKDIRSNLNCHSHRRRTFRVFVSSTFSDLKAERNALQEHVFPNLREFCESRGVRFQGIDLRWGVSREAGLDQRTMTICLAELRRCQEVSPRPNFIVLIGDSYGWEPLPPRIEAVEFERLMRRLSDADIDHLRFDEAKPCVRQGEGNGWYRWDQNALPTEYVLMPRLADSAFEESKNWTTEEAQLRSLLRGAVAAEYPDPSDPRRRRYFQSATHQEVEAGALAAENAHQHVFGYLRQTGPLPEPLGMAAAPCTLDGMKRQLMQCLPPQNIFTFPDSSEGSLQSLCARVLRDLRATIEAEIDALEMIDSLDAENEAHRRFGLERARHFVGRKEILEQIRSYVRATDPHLLIIHGESGSGKTALMSETWLQLDASVGSSQDSGSPVIVGRLIGSTPESSNIRSLLTNLGRQIERAFGAEPTEVPWDLDALFSWIYERFGLAQKKQRLLVLFLDALDQLLDQDLAHSLRWLPTTLPSHVRIVVSVLERPSSRTGQCFLNAKSRFASTGSTFIPLPHLHSSDSVQLLTKWLDGANRQLSEPQWEAISGAMGDSKQPLWLKVVFEEARGWHSWQVLSYGLPGTGSPGESMAPLCSDLGLSIDRYLLQLANPRRHQPLLVERSLAYLAISRRGLTEDEILRILQADEQYWEDFSSSNYHEVPGRERCLPVALWSRLYHDLKGFLVEQSSEEGLLLIGFYHRLLKERIEELYVQDDVRTKLHGSLGNWFSRQPLWFSGNEGGPPVANHRKVSEQFHHFVEGNDASALFGDEANEGTANSLEFLLAKALCGQAVRYAYELSSALRLIGLMDSSEAARRSRIQEYRQQWTDYSRTEDQDKGEPPRIASVVAYAEKTAAQTSGEPRRNSEFALEIHGFLTQNLGVLSDLSTQPSSLFFSLCNSTDHAGLKRTAKDYLEKSPYRAAGFERLFPRRLKNQEGGVAALTFPAPGDHCFLRADTLLETYAALSLRRGLEIRNTSSGAVVDLTEEIHPNYAFDVSPSGSFSVVIANPTDAEVREAIMAKASFMSLRPWAVIDHQTGNVTRHLNYDEITVLRILPCETAMVFSNDTGQIFHQSLVGSEPSRLIAQVGGRLLDLFVVEGGKRIIARAIAKTGGAQGNSGDCVISLDFATGREQWRFEVSGRTFEGMDVTPDGSLAIVWNTISRDGALDFIDARNGALKSHLTSPMECWDAKISDDGKRLVVAGDQVRVFDLEPVLVPSKLSILEEFFGGMFGPPGLPGHRPLETNSFAPESIQSFDLETKKLQITPDAGMALVVTHRSTIERIDLCAPVIDSTPVSFDLPLASIQYGSDESQVIVSDFAKNTKVIDLESGMVMHVLRGHADIVWKIIRGNGWIATSSADMRIRIWDASDYSPVKVLREHVAEVCCLTSARGGQVLVSGSSDGEIKLWSTSDWSLLNRCRCESAPTALAGFPSADYLAVGMKSGALAFLTLSDFTHVDTDPTRHAASISGIFISPDQSRCLTVGHDGMLVLTDLSTGQERYRQKDANEKVMSVSPTFGEGLIATAGSDYTLSVWRLETGELIARNEDCGVAKFDLSSNGQELIGGSRGPLTRIRLGENVSISKVGELANVYGLVLYEDDGKHAVTALGGRIQRISLESGSVQFETRVMDSMSPGGISAVIRPYVAQNATWALHPHETASNILLSLELPSGRERFRIGAHRHYLELMAICEEQNIGVTVTNPIELGESELFWWSLDNGLILGRADQVPQGDSFQSISALAVCIQGGEVFSGTNLGAVYVIDKVTGTFKLVCEASSCRITRLAVSPDGRTIAAGDEAGRVIVFSMATGLTEFVLKPHRSKVTALLFFPNAHYLLSAGEDSAVKIISVAAAQEMSTYLARHPVESVVPCFSQLSLAVNAHGVELVRITGFGELFRP